MSVLYTPVTGPYQFCFFILDIAHFDNFDNIIVLSFYSDWSAKEKHHLAQELSDVLIYLVRLAEKCHVDLPQEVVAKIAVNCKKYPAHLVKGSNKKYTEYHHTNGTNSEEI